MLTFYTYFYLGIGMNYHINFLDVHVDATQPNILCSVYQNPLTPAFT